MRLSASGGAPISRSRLLWLDRATSLWAPPIALVACFVGYVLAITPSAWAATALPAWMRGAFWALVACEVGLGAWRLLWRGASRARALRVEARAVLAELRAELGKAGMAPAAREALERSARALDEAIASGDAALGERLEALSRAAGEARVPASSRGWAALAALLGKAVLAALLIRTVLLEPYRIPTGSMLPTLQVGDQIFVNRFVYGVRVPFTNWVPFPLVRRPERGDVVVFEDPISGEQDLVKRVAGVPGDELELVDDEVRINGVAQPRTPLGSYLAMGRQSGVWVGRQSERYLERLGAVEHEVLQSPSHPGRGRQGPWRVPPGHVFVLGDNRDDSSDSRFGFRRGGGVAFVPYGHIKGKAVVIWLSVSHQGMFSTVFGGTGLRTDRLFLPVR